METINIINHINENHSGNKSENIKSISYGGIDGIITTFSIICSSYAAMLNIKIIFLLSLSNLISDGFSMGFGDYISSRLETNYIKNELKKETHEYDTNLDSEKNELIEIYKTKYNMSNDDSIVLVNILSENKILFLNYMMFEELDLDPNLKSKKQMINTGIYTFISFVLFGSIPMISYMYALFFDSTNYNLLFLVSLVLSLISLVIIGIFISIITGQKKDIIYNSLLTLINGIIAFILSYLIGYTFNALFFN